MSTSRAEIRKNITDPLVRAQLLESDMDTLEEAVRGLTRIAGVIAVALITTSLGLVVNVLILGKGP